VGNHPEALKNIDALRCSDTYVVIGGQQAGVLTGPLYTIYKAVHLIQAAKKLSAQLETEVIPVFWIAGEDHDIDEVDHLYWLIDQERTLHKERISLQKKGRKSASQLPLDEDAVHRFLESFFNAHTETVHTPSIRALLEDTAAASTTLAEWFARLMAELFGKHGLVLVESSLPFVRELERPMFQTVIEKNEEIARLLGKAEERLEAAGYPMQLKVAENQANLFLYEEGERLLVERYGEKFVNRRASYSREELLQLLDADPQRFSSNVVSRAFMQEHLFPTLAFVGGTGEVAYWAYYRDVFASCGLQMPIVLPRISVTLLEGALERLLDGFSLSLEQVLTGFADWKREWEKTQVRHPLEKQFAEARDSLLAVYRPLVEDVVKLDPGMKRLAEKNTTFLMEQVSFLEERLIRSLHEREDVAEHRLRRIEAALLPEGGWQERKLSFFSFANKHGLSLLDQLVEAPFAHDGSHQIFYL
jgi:bacillithiol biosynthesis cysteine-adding enzyme BshC